MGTIADKDREQLVTFFQSLANPVKIILFTQEFECQFCKMARELLEEVSGISGKISLEIYDFVRDKDRTDQYGIDKIPATVILGDRDYGIRFFGVPGGYEFTALVQDILAVGNRDPGLPQDVMHDLAKVYKPVHIQVMISPACPYCANAVHTAHRFAMAADAIRADMVETTEFPYLATKYNVHGVPHIVVNETYSFVGSKPEKEFLQEILKALQ
ncbi:MAG: protein disulfide oxidoreductase [Nitrospirota bacterium]